MVIGPTARTHKRTRAAAQPAGLVIKKMIFPTDDDAAGPANWALIYIKPPARPPASLPGGAARPPRPWLPAPGSHRLASCPPLQACAPGSGTPGAWKPGPVPLPPEGGHHSLPAGPAHPSLLSPGACAGRSRARGHAKVTGSWPLRLSWASCPQPLRCRSGWEGEVPRPPCCSWEGSCRPPRSGQARG